MDNNSYLNKNDILKLLGFETYTKYLQSSLWKKIRLDVLVKQEYKCCSCEKHADQVHHRKYTLQNLSGKDDNFLVAICKACHYRIEFTKKKKNTLYNANGLLDRKINKKKNKNNRLCNPCTKKRHKNNKKKITKFNHTIVKINGVYTEKKQPKMYANAICGYCNRSNTEPGKSYCKNCARNGKMCTLTSKEILKKQLLELGIK